MIKLFTDTSANLPVELINSHGIRVLPFAYTVDGIAADYSYDMDFDGQGFYNAMRAGADVKTSLINVGSFIAAFEEVLSAGDEVLYIGMSGGISGTANSAAIAVNELRGQYPQRSIAAIDTYAASLGEGLLVLDAAEMIAAGENFDSIVEATLTKRATLCQYFTVDDLVYLKKGGRLSGTAAFIGNILHIKPLLMGDDTGHIILCGKVRGRKHALSALADKYEALCCDKGARIGIAHADDEAGALWLLDRLRERGLTGECVFVCYEPVTGSHVGPGTIALFYPGIHK